MLSRELSKRVEASCRTLLLLFYAPENAGLKTANIRMHYLHTVTTQICKNHATIYIEDLKVRPMSASARGTLQNPGRNVSAKSGLNKSILDQGWTVPASS